MDSSTDFRCCHHDGNSSGECGERTSVQTDLSTATKLRVQLESDTPSSAFHVTLASGTEGLSPTTLPSPAVLNPCTCLVRYDETNQSNETPLTPQQMDSCFATLDLQGSALTRVNAKEIQTARILAQLHLHFLCSRRIPAAPPEPRPMANARFPPPNRDKMPIILDALRSSWAASCGSVGLVSRYSSNALSNSKLSVGS